MNKFISKVCYYPNPDIGKETVFPPCHCEHLKGACLHAVVTAFTDTICQLGVTVRRRGNLIEKTGLLRFTRNDESLNRDLGIRFTRLSSVILTFYNF